MLEAVCSVDGAAPWSEWSGVEWNGVECGFGGVHEGSSEGVLREESLSPGLMPITVSSAAR